MLYAPLLNSSPAFPKLQIHHNMLKLEVEATLEEDFNHPAQKIVIATT
jgi:hypothetical protein